MPVKSRIGIISLLVFGLLLFLSFNRHSKSGLFNYHSEVWADKAGYFVYLPATFQYGFKAASFPDSIDHYTGDGFNLNQISNRVETKYTYGVALLQSPFYLISNLFASVDESPVGFSKSYQKSINVAGVFYGVLGLVFLGLFLRFYVSTVTIYWTLTILFFGSHLFYYTIDETGMAHVYLFCLLAVLIYYWKKSSYLALSSFWSKLGIGFIVGLILIIRPTSILFLVIVFLWDIKSITAFKQRVQQIFQLSYLIPIVVGTLIAILPQLIYWKFTFGQYIYFSYREEGFRWLSPQPLSTWFSPNNGLFLYVPLFLLILISLRHMVVNKYANGWLIIFTFLLISYVFSAWWDWSFGCSFGARSFVEYLVLLSVPLAFFIQSYSSRSILFKVVIVLSTLLIVSYNLKMTYSYDGCFYGDHDWDWDYFWRVLIGPTK